MNIVQNKHSTKAEYIYSCIKNHPVYASMQVCKYVSMQLCKYASMQVCSYMQVCKYTHICKYTSKD